MAQKTQPETELSEITQNRSSSETNGKNEANGNSPTKKVKPATCFEIIKKILTFFTVEPFLLCYIIPLGISYVAVNQLNTEKACRVDLNYSKEICEKVINGEADDNITIQAKEEAIVLLTDMQSWQVPLASSFPLIIVLFVGAWSDRTGNRKLLMLLPILGELIAAFGLILATYFFLEWPLWATAIIEAVPTALSGGPSIALLGAFSYIADVTSLDARTMRMGAVAIIVTLGSPFGTSLSGILSQTVGYYGVFGIDLAIYSIGVLYLCFRIKDVNRVEQKGTILEQLKFFFNPKNVWDTLSVLILSRGKQRIQIILVICAHILIIGPALGEQTIVYQYTLARYNMTGVELGLYTTFSTLIGTAGTAVAVMVFSKYFGMHDTLLGMIAVASKTLSNITFGLAPTKEWFYSGAVFDFFGGSSSTAIRSLGTKIVDAENVAKMCSLIGFAEAVLPMVYGPLYLQIYANTFKEVPGATFFVGAAMTIPAFVIFLVMYRIHKKQEKDAVKNPSEKEKHAHDNDITSL